MTTPARPRQNVLQRLASLFRGSNPVPTSPDTARVVLEGLQRDFSRRVTAYANALAEGRVTLDTWTDLMSRDITRYHLSAALAANNNQPSAQVVALAQRNAETQLKYLQSWTDDIRSGAFPLDATRLRNRALLYRGAGNATMQQAMVQAAGIRLGQVPGDGQTVCRSWCLCSLEIIDGGTIWLVYWRISQSGIIEHCPDCERLARTWNPLRISKSQ